MWKRWWYILFLMLLNLCARSNSQKSKLDTQININFLRTLRNLGFNIFRSQWIATEERYLQKARDVNTVQEVIPDYIPFPCNVTGGRSAMVPNSVHQLRPGDVDVIAAMGDSLTAGAGAFADNILQIIVENRGVSATGGGQGTWRQYLTLPNIIKEFNPNLIGYALGDSLVSHEASQLNIAESGAFSEDMPYMAEVLVTRFKRHPKIDLQKHWKLISLFIGTNDFCSNMCWISSPWSILEEHKTHMLRVMRTLRDNLPRTLVALIPGPHLSYLFQIKEKQPSLTCFLSRNIECSCMYGQAYQKFIPTYYDVMRRWQELDLEIAALPEFQRNDFAVVAQPFIINMSIPLASDGSTDMTYLSKDCFHITQKTNALWANSLWNNLLEPVGTKKQGLNRFFETFYCPTLERPYLATVLNS